MLAEDVSVKFNNAFLDIYHKNMKIANIKGPESFVFIDELPFVCSERKKKLLRFLQ